MRSVAILALSCCTYAVLAQTLYPPTPDWTSTDIAAVSTGGALADLNHDGWLDFVVSNGNDMAQQHVAVYYNNGDGTLPTTPNWQSSDSVYNGHLDVADVNGDGWLDVAVATLGEFSTTGPIARVYLNNAGTLSSTPNWSANVIGNAFGVAFGDMNNDGRPDLAVATGWTYGTPHLYHNYVYLNIGTGLASSPSWTSSDTWDTQGALWVDADKDGWLDLAFAAGNTASRLYRNLGGTLETTASWQITDVASQDAIMLAAGDVNGDGVVDLLMADNNQLAGGSGRFRQYNGLAAPGTFATTAAWTYYVGYASCVTLADLDADNRPELISGGWWLRTRIFHNSGAGYTFASWWSSGVTDNVHEKIILADVNKDGLRSSHVALPADGARRLFQLPHAPIQEVVEIAADGVTLAPDQFHLNFEHGWFTVSLTPATEVAVDYTVSSRLDMAIANWDSERGNFLYYNRRMIAGDANCDGKLDFADINPFVMLLLGGYEQLYPDCDGHTSCDFNSSGDADFGDINGFVTALVGP